MAGGLPCRMAGPNLLDVVHHDVLDLVHLLLQAGHPGQLLRVLHAVVHVVLQPRSAHHAQALLVGFDGGSRTVISIRHGSI